MALSLGIGDFLLQVKGPSILNDKLKHLANKQYSLKATALGMQGRFTSPAGLAARALNRMTPGGARLPGRNNNEYEVKSRDPPK